MTRTVSIVPHTHWDREWYAPFQRFRLRLVDLLDDLLPRLEADPSFRHFMLDGQMAVIDDYLELRPDAAERIARLNRSGGLAMGPWYVLPDEFLVSGETLVRDLRLGLARAVEFGGAMQVGYLPDMFGHVAQMPQILTQYGFDHAVVWRGVPEAVDRSAFHWSAPDGSRVRTEYLPQGYGNGARLPHDPEALVGMIDDFVVAHGDLLTGPVLWMNGADHVLPRSWLGEVVAAANESQDDYRLVVRSLAEHLADGVTEGLPSWAGELRSGARSNLLMGVASNRVDVKIAAARAERALEAEAEPLSALFLPEARWPAEALDLAWREVIRNAAHDSICACSHDDVVLAVAHRYAEATHLAEGLTARALRHIARAAPVAGAVVVNGRPQARGGVVEISLPGEGPAEGLQILEQVPARERLHTITAQESATIVERELDIQGEMTGIDLDLTGPTVVVTLRCGPRLVEARPEGAAEVVADLGRLGASAPDRTVVVDIERPPRRRGLVRIDDVPGFGWQAWDGSPSSADAVEVTALSLDNGRCRVVVDPDEGTWSLDGLGGLGRLVDDGDAGDTYNYCPPDHDRVVDRPDAVTVTLEERGPIRGRLRISAEYNWPLEVAAGSRAGAVEVTVETWLELRAGEHFVRVETSLDNQCRDHRLRAWFPLPEPTTTTLAECAYTVVERGTVAEGGPTERPLATYPSRRFVRAGRLTVAHEGLTEHELVDRGPGQAAVAGPEGAEARALAITLLRCTGMLSQGPMATRPLPAGPEMPLAGPQMQGRHVVRYTVCVREVDPYALVDDAFVPLLVAEGTGEGDGPRTHQSLALAGAQVAAVERVGGVVHVRVFNPTTAATVVELPGESGEVLDLAGRTLGRFEGRVELAPQRIATLALDAR